MLEKIMKKMGRKRHIFFLGGADLEMAAIRKYLEQYKIPFVDDSLGWGAKASSYQDKIRLYNQHTLYTPVLVELVIDIPLPHNAVVVDHHNERAGEPSSILQVLDLLGIEPTRHDQLVAANDSGYIPAMEAMGATPEEIVQIRLGDRNAQGVTSEMEAEAERAISQGEVIGKLTIIKMAHSKTSTVADRLYGKADQLLILSEDGEANFFGNGDVCSKLKEKFDGWAGGAGLGKKEGLGYWGGYPNHDELVSWLVEEVKSL